MSQTWVYQKADDVRDLGEENAPWLVGWYEPDGRRKSKTFGAGPASKKAAQRFSNKTAAELMTGTYQQKSNVAWGAFVKEYTTRMLDLLEPRTKDNSLGSLAHYERLMKPVKVHVICTGHLDEFVSKRVKEPGQKKGSLVSPATVNKDLRHLKAAFNVAVEWGYLRKLPRFRMQKTPKKLIRFVTAEHFAAIYGACGEAKRPAGPGYAAADWWRALLVFAYMTGWRIGDLLALRREDLDLDGGYAISRWDDNKGDRDERVKLHRVVIDHVRKVVSFDPCVFQWALDLRALHEDFHRLQWLAGIHLTCRGSHEHTPACHAYGFHDLRRAFATVNAPRLTADALQALMRHKSYLTTQVYVNMSKQLDDAVNVLHVPDFLEPDRKKA